MTEQLPPNPPTGSTTPPNPPASQPIPPPYQSLPPGPNKSGGGNKFKMVVGGLVVLIVIMVIIIGVAAGVSASRESKPQTQPATTPSTNSPSSGSSSSGAQPSQTPAVTPAPAPTWQNVINVSGNAEKKTATFHLGSGQKKLLYNVTGDEYSMCLIYVMAAGTDINEVGGFPEVSASQPGSDTTYLTQSAGDYYLYVSAVNCTWTVTIQEMK